MGVPFYVICYFILLLFVAFNTLFLSLIFVSLITLCLGVFLLWFILPGTLWASWTWLTISFPMSGKFSAIILSNIFLGPFSLSSPSGTPKMQILVCLTLFQRSHRLCSFFFSFHSFFYILFCSSDFHLCPQGHLTLLPVILLLIPSNILFISVCSSRSLVNIYCIFSILFLRSWIIFVIIILNSFSESLLISTSFHCFFWGFILTLLLGGNSLLFFVLINFL